MGFELIRIAKNGDVFSSVNQGANYNERTLRYINMAKRGDQYYFEKIKSKCPGDTNGRKLAPMYFKIK